MNFKKITTILLLSLIATGCQKENDADKNINIESVENVDTSENNEQIVGDEDEKITENVKNVDKNTDNLDIPQLDIVFNGEKIKMPMDVSEFRDIFNVIDGNKDFTNGMIEIDGREYRYWSKKIGSTPFVYDLETTDKRADMDLPYGINTKEDSWADIKDKVPFENWVTLSSENSSALFYADNMLIELEFSSKNDRVYKIKFYPLHDESLEKFEKFMGETHGDIKGDSSITIGGKDLTLPLYFDNFEDFKKVPLDSESEIYKDVLDFFINSDRKKSSFDEDELVERNSEYLEYNFDEIDFYGTKLAMRKDMPKEENDDPLAGIQVKDRYFQLLVPIDSSISIKNRYLDFDGNEVDFDKIAEALENEDTEYVRDFKGDEEYIRFNLDNITEITYYKNFVSITKNTIFGGLDEWIEDYGEIKQMSFGDI